MPLMHESLLTWSFNGVPQPPLLCSPGQGKQLLIGHLLTEGLICSLSDVTDIHVESSPDQHWTVTTATSNARARLHHHRAAHFPCSPLLPDHLLSLLRLAPRDAGEHVAVIGNDRQHVTARDISRHYALDAAVGKALEAEMDLTGCIFCTSGRISLEVVRKAARVSIPVLCTEKAVGSLAADFAASEGIAIYCPGMTPAWCGDPQRFPAHSI